MRSVRIPASIVLVGAPACAAEQEPTADDGIESSDAGDTGTDFPAACNPDESPFLSADCLAALRSACRTHEDETACTTQPSFEFDGYGVVCGWANVLTFADATSCIVISEVGRCEAGLVQLGGLGAPCTAIPSELEIVELQGGPLGPWAAVDSEPGDYASTCAPNTSPPAAALCDCAPASCDVE
jgi:hypothetical protein